MPWSETTAMSQRLAFVEDALRGLFPFRTLCEHYGISPTTGYKWLERFTDGGRPALADRSRRPHRSPRALSDPVAALCLGCRRAHPTWGPRKLLAYLTRRHPALAWPAPSTVGAYLKREGLVRARRRRPVPGHPGRPQTPMDAPNAIWTVDFKGQFRTGDGAYCYPLTIIDGYSRYLLACRGLPSVATGGTQAVFTRLFQERGLPWRIRSDNGAPFATCALGRLSALSVWWLKLGITPELIEPAKPQQNGRHERLHRTLKAEATKPPRATLGAQQRELDRFRHEYNEERPHAALGDDTPAEHYAASPRPYPARLAEPEYPGHYQVRYVSRNGGIRWHNRWVNVSHVLAEEYVGLDEVADGVWAVYFGSVLLGRFEERDGRLRGAHNRNRL